MAESVGAVVEQILELCHGTVEGLDGGDVGIDVGVAGKVAPVDPGEVTSHCIVAGKGLFREVLIAWPVI